MFRKVVVTAFCCLFTAAILSSCSADKERPVSPTETSTTYKALKQKDDVLYNVELAWNELNVEQYDRLLDADFTFFFSETDYSSGKTPEQYNREQELHAMNLMRDKSRDDHVISIDLSLTYSTDDWTEVVPYDPQKFPDESWYVSNISYNITTKTANQMIYTSTGLNAQIWIRWATIPDTGAEHWRIVVWRDDV